MISLEENISVYFSSVLNPNPKLLLLILLSKLFAEFIGNDV